MTLLEAIAREEGFYLPHSRSGRNHNPGDLNWGPFARHHGATCIEVIPPGYHETPRFACFPDDTTGFAAMRALLEVPGTFVTTPAGGRILIEGYAGATLREALFRYAPPADHNDTSAYESAVCTWLGCTPDTPICNLLGRA
jgi:hypothetical protein